MTGLLVLLCTLAAATAVGVVLRSRNGRFRTVEPQDVPGAAVAPPDPVAAALRDVGVVPGASPVTLVQFSSAFCAPCRSTRVLLRDIAAGRPDVAHVEVDAESHLDEVRALDVRRTPTVLVVDAAGRVVGRASGLPRRAQVLAAVDAVAGVRT
ncbi:MAG: putative thioredoxin [Mycobacterium sp.]|nr:putative thioredoxin [Mycobacterium sp.]